MKVPLSSNLLLVVVMGKKFTESQYELSKLSFCRQEKKHAIDNNFCQSCCLFVRLKSYGHFSFDGHSKYLHARPRRSMVRLISLI